MNKFSAIIQLLLVCCLTFVMLTRLAAEVNTDGSLGAVHQISGPDFVIQQNLGKVAGNNLFHSFSEFNLNQNESAVFSGAKNIQNIISRITSGETSYINGTIVSDIHAANLFFLNPAGMVFGEHVSLDLSGSFYVSSADYLGFADGERFYVEPLSSQVLSTSAPVSFGFLAATQGDVNLSGSALYLASEQNIGIIAGDIRLDHGSDIFAPSGQVHLAAIRSAGEVPIDGKTNFQTNNTNSSSLGTLSIRDGSIIEVSNTQSEVGPGSVYIRGGQLLLDNQSHIYASSEAIPNGQIIAIQADNLTISEQSSIFSLSEGDGNGTQINLQIANHLLITEGGEIPELGSLNTVSGLISRTEGAGRAGDIIIQANDISLSNKASIDMSTFGSGDAGSILINADGTVRMVGNTRIFADSHALGQGGTIVIHAASLSIAQASNIDVGAFNAGNGGSINIHVNGDVTLTANSRIFSDSALTGNGGKTLLTASNLKLDNNSSIDSSSNAVLFDTQSDRGVYSQQGSGNAGDILISVSGSVLLKNESSINTASLWNFERNRGNAGEAGSINIKASDNIELSGRSTINSESANAGGGGLTLNAGNRVYLLDSYVSSSVQNGSGDGGDISVSSQARVILNQGDIIAQAFQGSGGNIRIQTNNFVAGQNSLVDASSELGIDGMVEIEAPVLETDNNTQVLSTRYLDTRQWQQQPCATRNAAGGRFVVSQRKGVANMPEDMMSAGFDDLPLRPQIKKLANTKSYHTRQPLAMQFAGQAYEISCLNWQ